MLSERGDIACVYALFEGKPSDVKLEEQPPPQELHTGMVRAIVTVH